MMHRSLMAAAAAALLAGCAVAVPPGGAPTRDAGAVCVGLFQEFDRLARTFAAGPRPEDDFVVSPPLARQGNRLLRAGCITRSADLTGLAARPQVRVAEGGAAIRPIALHAGVVTGITDEARVRGFFAAQGVRVRSVGHAALGRRIYLGPFDTEDGLRSAAALAREAGFIAPYAAFF